MSALEVRTAVVVFREGCAPWVPQLRNVAGKQFLDIRANYDLKKLVGWKTTEYGLSSSNFLKELRNARNTAVDQELRAATGEGDDPFAEEVSAKSRKKRVKTKDDNIALPKIVQLQYSDHPDGHMNVLTTWSSNDAVSVEMNQNNMNFIVGRVQAEVDGPSFERAVRPRRDDAPSIVARTHPHVFFDKERNVYGFHVRGPDGQRHYKSHHVAHTTDPDQELENHDDAARAAITAFEMWKASAADDAHDNVENLSVSHGGG